MPNAAKRGQFLLNSNRAHGGVENKDSGRSTIAKIDVIEEAEAYLHRWITKQTKPTKPTRKTRDT